MPESFNRRISSRVPSRSMRWMGMPPKPMRETVRPVLPKVLYSILRFPQFFVFLVGCSDAVHGRAPEAALLQHPQSRNGAAPGGADRVLQGAGMGVGA